MPHTAYHLTSALLCSMGAVNLSRSQLVPLSHVERNHLYLCAFTTLTGGIHYALIGIASSYRGRVLLRYSDWLMTVPIIQMQFSTVDRPGPTREELHSTYTHSILMLAAALPCHFVTTPSLVVGLAAVATLTATDNVARLKGSKRTILAAVYQWYTFLFLADLCCPSMRSTVDVLFSLSDMMIKVAVSMHFGACVPD